MTQKPLDAPSGHDERAPFRVDGEADRERGHENVAAGAGGSRDDALVLAFGEFIVDQRELGVIFDYASANQPVTRMRMACSRSASVGLESGRADLRTFNTQFIFDQAAPDTRP